MLYIKEKREKEKKRKYVRTLIVYLDNGTIGLLYIFCTFLYFPEMLPTLYHRFFFSHSPQIYIDVVPAFPLSNTEIIHLIIRIVFLSKRKTL